MVFPQQVGWRDRFIGQQVGCLMPNASLCGGIVHSYAPCFVLWFAANKTGDIFSPKCHGVFLPLHVLSLIGHGPTTKLC